MKFTIASLLAIASASEIPEEFSVEKQVQIHANEKIYINLYYEALCPYCRHEITNNIRTAMLTPGFSDMVDLEIWPYGNARETQNSDGTWSFTCQHGEHECVWNLWESCINNFRTYYGPLQSYEWIECIEMTDYGTNYADLVKSCGMKVGIADKFLANVDSCAKGSQGNVIQHRNAVVTGNLNPPHKYVPWYTSGSTALDQTHTDAMQGEIQQGMLAYVCKNYKGPNRAAACSQQFPELDATKTFEYCDAENVAQTFLM